MKPYPKSEGPMAVTRDAAAYIGLAEGTLNKRPAWGPPHIKLGKKVVYRFADLDEWLESRKSRRKVAA